MATVNFLLPDLGEGLTEARIVAWSVAIGDTVKLDQKLGELETDKAVTDIPSPVAGRVVRLGGAPGDTLAVGAVLVEFDDGSTNAATPELVGSGARPDSTPSRRRRAVVQHAPTRAAASPRATSAPMPGARAVRSHVETLEGYRAAAVPRLEESARDYPRAAASLLADASGLDAMRNTTDAQGGNIRLGEFVTLLAVVVEMLRRHPRINASFVPGGSHEATRASIRYFDEIGLAIAVDTPLGLAVPVIHDAASLTAAELAERVRQLAETARAHHLKPADTVGATFTITNHGRLGTDDGFPIINPPAAAILAVGRFAERPVVIDGQVVARRTVPLTLVFDHRVIDGADAARFLVDVAGEIGPG